MARDVLLMDPEYARQVLESEGLGVKITWLKDSDIGDTGQPRDWRVVRQLCAEGRAELIAAAFPAARDGGAA